MEGALRQVKTSKKILATVIAATMPIMAGCALPPPSETSPQGFIQSITSIFSSGGSGGGKGNLEMLESLPSVDKSQAPAYQRSYFGPAWTDNNTVEFGGNGCSTRNDILNRDLSQVRKEGDCKVIGGVLKDDPYTGKDITFIYGPKTSSAVQIDHVVALKDAWVSGAYLLTYEDRVNFANDPEVLLASDGPQNMSKGDKDASKWLVPQNQKYRCTYAKKQVYIKNKYRLGVSTDERAALRNQLSQC